MAGFFGLFNYEKEGPGIEKNAPKKKTFIVFFETFFRNFWKFITINLLYNLISIPILTNGLANVGATHVARNTARDKHSFGVSDFFDTIKKNWKQALGAGIINVIIYLLLIFAFWFYFSSANGIFATIGLGIALAMFFIFTVMNYYIWTLIITFKYTIRQVYKISFQFVFINLKNNLICVFSMLLVDAAFFFGLFFSLSISVVFVLLLFLFLGTYPMFKALLIQFCTFPSIIKYIIEPYYAERPDEDIKLRHDLGLKVPGDDEEAEDEDGEFEDDNDDYSDGLNETEE